MQNNIKFFSVTLLYLGLTGCQTNSVKDIEGNVYTTITIGTQVWMAENLKTTKYRNGDLIVTTVPATLVIEGESTPKYQWAYAGNESNVAIHGRLYTWYVATDIRNVCPTGWHVPTCAEWTTLTDFLINNGYGYGTGYMGKDIAKSMAATTGWVSDDTPGSTGNNQASNNSTGFTATPSGYRLANGTFNEIGHIGNWWSTSSQLISYGNLWSSSDYVNILGGEFRNIYHDYCYMNGYFNPASYGMSIRCVKDN
jgi:uncharacterized protein (TIGR02145 family)